MRFQAHAPTINRDRLYMQQSEWEKLNWMNGFGLKQGTRGTLVVVHQGDFFCEAVTEVKASDGRIFLIHNPVGGACDGGSFSMRARNPLSLWVSDDGMKSWAVKVDLVKDTNPHASLNYPDGYIDEANSQIDLVWEDTYSVYRMRIPLNLT